VFCRKIIKSGPDSATVKALDLIVIASEDAVHGPLPSGSGIFQVKVIVVPISDIAGI
jgi:hypothetical protein